MFDCVADKRGNIVEVELLHDIGAVCIDSSRTDEELFGNLLIGETFGNKSEDLFLSFRQRNIG